MDIKTRVKISDFALTRALSSVGAVVHQAGRWMSLLVLCAPGSDRERSGATEWIVFVVMSQQDEDFCMRGTDIKTKA